MSTLATKPYIYLYDLPRDKTTSIKIAEAFKAKGITIVTPSQTRPP